MLDNGGTTYVHNHTYRDSEIRTKTMAQSYSLSWKHGDGVSTYGNSITISSINSSESGQKFHLM